MSTLFRALSIITLAPFVSIQLLAMEKNDESFITAIDTIDPFVILITPFKAVRPEGATEEVKQRAYSTTAVFPAYSEVTRADGAKMRRVYPAAIEPISLTHIKTPSGIVKADTVTVSLGTAAEEFKVDEAGGEIKSRMNYTLVIKKGKAGRYIISLEEIK